MIIETISYSYDYLDDFYNEIYIDNLLCGLGIHQEVFEYFDELYFNDFKNDFSLLFTKNFIKFRNDIINRNKNIILNILKNKKLSYLCLSEAIINYY